MPALRSTAPGAGAAAGSRDSGRSTADNSCRAPAHSAGDRVESEPIPSAPSAPGQPGKQQGLLAPGGIARSVLQVGGALAIVIGLLLIGRAVAARLTGKTKASGGRGLVEVLARHPLSKHQSLVLVRIGAQIVAINQGRDSGQSVLVINDPIEVASILGQVQGSRADSMQASFRHLLGHAQKDMEKPLPPSTPVPDAQTEEEMANLDDQLDDMAAARRQLMELRKQVQSVRQNMTVQ